MRYNSILLLCLFILIGSNRIFSQSYSIKHLGVEDGLSNSYIVDIAQDGQGFIWVATESGLNRFDGKNFTVYRKDNSDLVSNELNTLLYDKETNSLWIGSQRDGISVFDCFRQTFQNYVIDKGLITNDVTHLSHAADSGIWITHYHAGVVHYNKETQEFTHYEDRKIEGMKSQNWCSCDDGNGKLYIGHAFDGMSILDIKNRTAKNIRHDPNNPKSLPGNAVRCIYIDHSKNIWVGTNQGLALLDPKTEEFITFKNNPNDPNSLGSNMIFDIKGMKDGTLWITTDMSGISILDLRNITLRDPQYVHFQNITVSSEGGGLASSNIRRLFQDSFDNIWIGNYRKELDFISDAKTPFKVLPYAEGRNNRAGNKQIWSICTDALKQIWVGGINEVVVFKDNVLQKTIDLSFYLLKQHRYINAIQSDTEGMIWLGIYNDGVLKLNPENDRVERVKSEAEDLHTNVFYEDPTGKMWIGTSTGLYSFQNNAIVEEEIINNQLADRDIYSILYDTHGNLWVGTFGRGIYVFKNQELLTHLNRSNGFCSNAVYHLYLDSRKGVWAATRDGIAYFENTSDPNRYEISNNTAGLEDNHVRAIQEDELGNIWLSTNNGISSYSQQKNKFDNYDYRNGIPIGNFIEGSSCIAVDGTVYFGSLNGVTYFNPKDLMIPQPVVPVQIVKCVGFNKQIEESNEENLILLESGKVKLPYNRNSFQIVFSVPDYSQNQLVEYSYMMEGLDNIWYDTQGENQVTFRNISPGEYTFKVMAKLQNQDWDEASMATVHFNISPPVWFTWYAYLFYAIVLGLAFYYYLRSYKHKVNLETSLKLERKNSQNKQALNDERLRFYTNIAHELRTPLTLILGPLEDLQNDSKLSSDYKSKIDTIHGSANRLLDMINQILEFRKTETQNRKLTISKGNLANLVKEVGLRYKELNQNDKTSIRINVDKEDTILYFDADMLTAILNNLLSNSIKYTPEGEINLNLRSYTEANIKYTEIEVRDTGYGIDDEALPYIFDRYYQAKGKHQASGTGIGLAIVKSLAELHEGTIKVESKVGKGTAFIFRILTDNIYPNALHVEAKKQIEKSQEIPEILSEKESDIHPVVLVVEDNNDIREYISVSLKPDYTVITAANGKEGLDLALKYIPNIIVSDIMMPEMDGIELCRKIKEDIQTSHIPVILLTAKDSIRDKEEGYESGADSYVTKPFSAKLLRSRIQNLLESRRKLAEWIAEQTKGLDSGMKEAPQTVLKMSKLDEEFLAKVTAIIEENLNMDRLDIPFLREKMNMSHSTFYRKIKGLTGISANEFIRKVRLKNSLQLLVSGSYNISETAYMTGFNDVAYFRLCFKEEYGMTPSDYIKQHS